MIFSNPEDTWEKIKSKYQTTFKDLVTGKLPEESDLLESMKAIAGRLKTIEWKIIKDK